ncbi:MAG: molybdopterin molybdotransferase MoeA [Deltaproteobacteria bacterium]|jgi:molybdopterin molybdotransferase|nr:molybdopterin molybdotransferase MoeA [Deltaproteobacteria bacterium]
MAHFLSLKSVDQILGLIAAFPALEAEETPLSEALGRVLAAPFTAPEDLPGFSRSTMDGFAVRAKDVFGASEGLPALLDLLGECPMGEVPAVTIRAGQCARVWTGGMLPAGADAVVMLEYAREAGNGQVELTRPAAPLENVIMADEDAARGQELLPGGRALRAQELGLLAAFGAENILVRRKPRVAVLSSGDEVVPPGAAPRPGQVRDINSYSLAGLVQSAGGECRRLGIAADTEESLRGLLETALDWADVILVSGGSSAGMRDCTLQTFTALGAEILAHGVAISPGKPLILASLGEQSRKKSLWGLPGHAAGAMVCAEVFIRPLLRQLSGVENKAEWRQKRRAILARALPSAQGRRDYIRVRLNVGEASGLPTAIPILGKSGLISTLVEADALIICPEDQEGLYAGQVVELHELL